MISNQTLSNCIREITEISKKEMAIVDSIGVVTAVSGDSVKIDKDLISSFMESDAMIQECLGYTYVKIYDEDEPAYTLVIEGGEESILVGKLAAAQIRNLVIAYKEKVDRDSFFQNLLLENMLTVDIYNKSKKLHIKTDTKRCVYVIEPVGKREAGMMEIVKELFYAQNGDFVTSVDDNHIVVIKSIEDTDPDAIEETARIIVDMVGAEVMQSVKVAYGNIVDDIKSVPKSYKEAMMSLDVGKIFYIEKAIIAYNSLGIGRLIYQLPINLCELYVKEIFGEEVPSDIDDEMLNTVNKFFENNLNVSETSRQLCMHRNTLLYRIEKVQRATGLDIRVFDDALALKIALMVVNYIKYIEEKDN